MISVGVKELKAKLSSYMRLVRKGEEVIVTDHGREVALVIPISKERQVIKSLGALIAATFPKRIILFS